MTERTSLRAWQALRTHADEIGSTHLRDLFGSDAARFDGLHVEALASCTTSAASGPA
jgi:hypothetical protein